MFVIDDDMDSDTAAESNLSLKSRSFLDRMNDRLRKTLDHSSEVAMQDIDKRSMIWKLFMSSTLQASVFMGKNYSDSGHSIKNTEDLTMKQIFDISEKLITVQSDEVYGMSTSSWEHSSWKYLSLVGDEQVISLLHKKVYVFQDSVSIHGKELPEQLSIHHEYKRPHLETNVRHICKISV